MSKSEKIVDMTFGIMLFIVIFSLLVLGSIKISSIAPSNNSTTKNIVKPIQEDVKIKCVRCGKINKIILFKSPSIPDSITIDCMYCKWENTRSIIQLRDTTSNKSLNN